MTSPLSNLRAPADARPDRPGETPSTTHTVPTLPTIPAAPGLPAAEAERFFTEGSPAWPPPSPAGNSSPSDSAADCLGCLDGDRPHRAGCRRGSHLKHPEDTCCTGVDVPSVGLVHRFDCPRTDRAALRANQPGMPHIAGKLPEPLQSQVAQELARAQVELLYAARDLAEAQIVPADRERSFPADCGECCVEAVSGVIAHESRCRTGRVLRAVTAFIDAGAHLVACDPGVPARELLANATGFAGNAAARDVVRPGRPYTCRACGATDEQWTGEKRPEDEVLLATLERYQAVTAPLAGEYGHIRWTHACGRGGAR